MTINYVEYINALGPFDHGIWEGRSADGSPIRVGDQALFRNRAGWLAEKISSFLTNEYSFAELRTMTLLEIGSYDGWVLTEICKQIVFAEAIGIEPRHKNILKGNTGRELAGIETKAQFIEGGVADLKELFENREFDIVLCLGMLHHVSSTYDVVSEITRYAGDLVIVDSMIVPELEDDIERLEPYVNTRDIIYHGEEGVWSIAAFKHESPYGDGSRSDFGIVNIPSRSLIEMSLQNCGFEDLQVLGSEEEFFDRTEQALRGVKELLAVSRRSIPYSDLDKKWRSKVWDSEDSFCHVSLPDPVIWSLVTCSSLFDEIDLRSDMAFVLEEVPNTDIDEIVKSIMARGLTEEDMSILRSEVPSLDAQHFEILAVIFRSPREKVLIEVGKFFLANGHASIAVEYLRLIVRQLGCDWWSFYRACYLLGKAFRYLGQSHEEEYYDNLLTLSNENFPFRDSSTYCE